MKLRTWCIRIGHILTKTGSALKMALLLMLVCSYASVFAELDTQGITIRQQNVPLEKIFQSIEKQTGYYNRKRCAAFSGTRTVAAGTANGCFSITYRR